MAYGRSHMVNHIILYLYVEFDSLGYDAAGATRDHIALHKSKNKMLFCLSGDSEFTNPL